MTAPKRDSAAWQGGEVGKAGGNQRRDHTAVAPLVELDHGEVWTTSLLIADKFSKRHADVLRAVEKLECSGDFTQRNFALSDYTDATGRRLPMFRISRDGFAFLAMGFTGRAAAAWKERFIAAFGKMERELRRIAVQKSLPDWQEARQLGKADRRDLTDVVQALCLRAHERGDSTTPLHLWMTAATRVVTSALFETNTESIKAIRGRLTARQLRRLSLAEETYARALDSLLDTDAHHRAINEQGKVAVLAFAAATGGREVPGVDRGARRAALKQRGSAGPNLLMFMFWAAVVVTFAVVAGGA